MILVIVDRFVEILSLLLFHKGLDCLVQGLDVWCNLRVVTQTCDNRRPRLPKLLRDNLGLSVPFALTRGASRSL